MGVIERYSRRVTVMNVSAESINSLGISQPATPPSEPESVGGSLPTFVPRRRNFGQLLQRLENHCQNQRAGTRRIRRNNNTRALQTLVEDELEESNELSLIDLHPQTENAFSRLLSSNEDMMRWQDFVARSEREQRDYLEAISSRYRNNNGRPAGSICFTREAVNPNDKALEAVPPMSDSRTVHPAFNEEIRFSMMEPQLQSILKRKHLPLGLLSSLEQEIIKTFIADPSAVFINQDLSSFERLLIHAICQYNFLRSKSKSIDGVRKVTVKNTGKCFHAPEMSLTQYIETYHRAK